MTAPVLNIVDRLPANECQKSAIELLEAMIDKVRAGEVATVGIICVTPDGSTYALHSKSENVNLLIAGASRLMHRLNAYLEGKTQ